MTMAESTPFPERRRRGVILSPQGWKRLQQAEQQAAQRDNQGYPYTLEQLSLITGLSTNTLTKVRRRQKPVDISTVELYFQAFGLDPTRLDYQPPQLPRAEGSEGVALREPPLKGPLTVESPFYLHRPPVESSCFQAIAQPGCLIRIKAPRQFGKTSLLAQLATYGQNQGYRVAIVSFHLLDRAFLQSTSEFMRWFCGAVARALAIPNQLEQHWDDLFGGSYGCTDYFERYLLPQTDRPLLLLIDGVDELFAHGELALDFFGMVRAWYEQSAYGGGVAEWQRLRLVLTHALESTLPFNPHQSPFNVGLAITLPPLNLMQVKELAFRYGLQPSETYAARLAPLLGGHPYLTQLSLGHLSQTGEDLADWEAGAIAYSSILGSHLRQQGERLEAEPELAPALQSVIAAPDGVRLPPRLAFRLHSLGWVQFTEQRCVISCELYRQYFQALLADPSGA